MTTSHSGRIGIIGLTGSGKSTYLAVLERVITHPWHVTYSGETLELVRETHKRIDKGQYPKQTEMSGFDQNNYEFTINKSAEKAFFGLRQKPSVEMVVRIRDIGGGHADPDNQLRIGDTRLYDEYLHNCQGLLFLIDPLHTWITQEEDSNRYWNLFNDILTNIDRRHPRSNIHTAFCITKIDTYLIGEPEIFGRCVPDFENSKNFSTVDTDQLQVDLKKCADKKIFEDHENTIKRIDSFAKRPGNYCQWFASSATGWVELGKEEFADAPQIYQDQYKNIAEGKSSIKTKQGKKLFPQWYLENEQAGRIYDVRRLKPYGIAEPLKWLFIEVAKKKLEIPTNEKE